MIFWKQMINKFALEKKTCLFPLRIVLGLRMWSTCVVAADIAFDFF
jgi:hypothetical protein